ncbi:hypothetical protein N792_07845 [Lysobacter concretionis Ko07 = DSM 16239]|uniref:Uncharacterized protein n=1 Tax=Lysobacter concretionis Ko07 = DSM 16239 TaxID=1122185 RepID=A0A0A0ESV1_9GAMM|nr:MULTISPECIES: hypothetical protein [Lysobacter]KGM52222.1 hypothetical protein N792_07845 [Lysobacter concretionis Ko07 = DSM 16239]QOD90039.1 hypothetical protein H2514_07155 [Lysobacter sp. CW239]
MDAVMRHHRAAWRVERVGWIIIALLLTATLLGAFGGGPISHARSGSTQALAVEYDRLLRSHAPTEYRFQAHPSVATGGVVRLRIDNVLMDLMEVDSIVPAPDAQMGGVGYTEFAFLMAASATSPISIVIRFRPATFGRYTGQVSVAGAAPLSIDHVVYP